MQTQSNSLITFDTQLKTALSVEVIIVIVLQNAKEVNSQQNTPEPKVSETINLAGFMSDSE